MADTTHTPDFEEEKYWYNLQTGQVEKGMQSAWDTRMGPYDTEEEARHALQTARKNTEAWDSQDQNWENN